MKRFLFTILFSALLYCNVNADTIINVPIDSRPISDEYLSNLADIGRDKYISVDKKNMDFFSSYEPDNHLGKSSQVRKELATLVKNNNNKDTTVIINTSTYITNGLVGSRCAVNYTDYKSALDELYTLVSTNKEVRYYVNMPMPRALPETRFNTIWPNSDKVNGLAYYYLKENTNVEDYNTIYNSYAKVTPEQLLMEYGYVENKALEIGGAKNLSVWERDFLNYFNSIYKTKSPYSKYVEAYKSTYYDCADIYATLVKYQKEGLIDEIVVSNDDLQLPNSVTYFYNNGANWVQSADGSAIKYSFARTYSLVAPNSIANTTKTNYGRDEYVAATIGRGKHINIINGTDEVPQLIYARDYSKRKNITPKYNITTNKLNSNVAAYDVKRAGIVANAAVNFASGNVGIYTDKPVDMYIYDYNHEGNQDYIIKNINNSINRENYTALIELFGSGSVNGNYIFNNLLRNDKLANLASYSAWNTNGNAIGLGVAQAQVFAVADNKTNSSENTAIAQSKMLLQHFVEDGVYTCKVKKELANKGYRPNVEDRTNSQMLYDALAPQSLIDSINNHNIKVGGDNYIIQDLTIDKTSFPWGRTFDILIKSSANVKKVK